MAEEKQRSIFRKESLERLSSPDRLDQLLRVIKPQAWIILVALAFGMAIVITWSILGSIPSTANGTAILIKPKKVVPFQSPGSGQLHDITVEVGDRIVKGQVIALLRIPDLEKDIELEQDRIQQFQKRKAAELAIERDLAGTKRRLIEERRSFYKERISQIEEDAQEILEIIEPRLLRLFG